VDKRKFFFKKVKKTLKRLTSSEESLLGKTVKGGFWVFSLRITNRFFQFIRTIILARMLAPNDFGVFGIALLLLSMLETFSRTGFGQALIQKRGRTEQYLNTAWTVNLIRGFIIAIILFFIARPASVFFDSIESLNIIRVISLVVILQSANNIAVIYFEKELEFHKFFKYRFAATIADVTVAIIAVIILRNVWALVFGLLAGNLVQCIMSYVISPYRPRISLDIRKAKELFKYGKWIFLSSMLVFLIIDVDDIFVGKILGATMLGFYQMAYKISNMPSTEVTSVVSTVSFPAYSKLQGDIGRLKNAYMKILQFITLLSFPIAGVIIAFASDFTGLFLGDKWVPMVPTMMVLAIWGAIRSVGAAAGELLKGIGRPNILFRMHLIQVFIIIVLIYPLTLKWNILGTAIAILISAVIMNLIRNILIVKIFKCSSWEYYRVLTFPFIITIVPVVVVLLLKEFIFTYISIQYFLICIAIFIIIFSLLIYLFNRLSIFKIGKIFKDLKDRLKS